MGKRKEQSEQRRWQILQIALDEFIVKGYYGTSTREIGKIADISSGLMFHYFSTKQVLYETLIELGCSKLSIECAKKESPIAALESKLNEMIQMISNDRFSAKMFVFMGYATYNAGQISQKAGELFVKHDLIQQSIPLIQRGQELGEIRPGDPHALSIAFWCSVQGIAEAVALIPERPIPEIEWIMNILRRCEK